MATRAAGVFGSVYGRLGRAETLLAFCGSGAMVLALLALRLWHEGVSPGLAEWSLWALALWPCIVGTVRVLAGQHAGLLAAGLWMMAVSGALMAAGLAGSLDVQGWSAWGSLLAVFGAGWLWVQFERLGVVWGRLKGAIAQRDRSDADARIVDRGLREPFAHMVTSLFGLSAVGFASPWSEADMFVTSLLTLGVVASFLPLVFGIWNKSRFEAKHSGRIFIRDEHVSGGWVVAILLAAGSVTALAMWAVSSDVAAISEEISYATFIFVLAMFFAVIVSPNIQRGLRRWRERKELTPLPATLRTGFPPLDALASGASRIDSMMVQVVAPMSGATQRQYAHAYVFATLILLSALGFIMPKPFGLVPIIVGIIFAVALGRRWAWVEADRETASRLQRTDDRKLIRLGFENDLKDEALLAYAGLFVLVPLILFQIQEIAGIEGMAGARPDLAGWIVFFGGELAKAVPFVDWWDIYGGPRGDDGPEPSEIGKHLTFASRAMVDLVILAALFQAISIWQRNRVQDQLYDDGHLEAFDPFKEQEFFEDGLVRLNTGAEDAPGSNAYIEKLRREKRLATLRSPQGKVVARFKITNDFMDSIGKHIEGRQMLLNRTSDAFEFETPYSTRRLAELLHHENEDVRAGAQWMVERWSLLVGDPLQRLEQLTQRWSTKRFPACCSGHEPKSVRERRGEKLRFERLLVELAEPEWSGKIRTPHIEHLMECLRLVRGEVEFEFARVLAIEVFARLKTRQAVLHLSKLVVTDQHLIAWDDLRSLMNGWAGGPSTELCLGRQEMRSRVYEALAEIACNRNAGLAAARLATDILLFMSEAGGDASQVGRQRAAACWQTANGCLQARQKLEKDDDDPSTEPA